MPVPYFQDEFSYMLAADTFVHGRVTNPTHPMWEHFEALQDLQKPTYMSRYPPAQGFFMAAGQILFGHIIYGVWLSAALMCMAICWMLYAWLPPRWAFLGGLVGVLQFGVFTYWSQSYWGGAVAALGGALVFGALPRIIKYQRLRDALYLGLGIGILANSRPVEGILFGIPLGCLLLPWKIKWQSLDKRRLLKNAVLPLVLLVLAIAILTGTYNKKITGNALLFPHVLYSKLYSTIPVCIWQPLYPQIQYNHKALADLFTKWNIHYYQYKRSWEGFTQDMFQDSVRVGMFFFGFPLALPSLAILIRLLTFRKTAGRYFISLCIILFMLGMGTYIAKPHYYASLTCLAVLLITMGIRGVYRSSLCQKQTGPVTVIFLIGLQLFFNIVLTPPQPVVWSLARISQGSQINLSGSYTREELRNILMKRGGKYLVIVRYPSGHNYFFDWVYNDADIDHAPIVWARDMGGRRNAELLNYFKDRQVLFIMDYWDMGFPHYDARQ